jgi:hypothetical protein
MGLNLFSSGNYEPPNPNPRDFEILWVLETDDYLLAKVRYPQCTTFDGEKLLLFKGLRTEWLYSLKVLDPHFYSESNLVARFKPDDEGLKLAMEILNANV